MFVLAVIVTVTASLLLVQGEQVTSPYQISASPLLGDPLPLICCTLFQVVTPPPETEDTLMHHCRRRPRQDQSIAIGWRARQRWRLRVGGPEPATASWTWVMLAFTTMRSECP